ncbi:Protein XRI1 [Quillaja saponaria]|uniref:Protein XRI1 n=1 Tax=Quillaja saponaria TaxID=32244 RepID=A0AAD7L2V1_QUISA|nr:Protein XRI1 [Quillaja saponaria]
MDPWNWHGKDYCFQKNSDYDISQDLLNGVPQNEEDLSYMFDETTPVKACGDLAYHVSHNDEIHKGPEGCKETHSQVKRRRMLQFSSSNDMDLSLSCEETSSVFLKLNEREDSVEEVFPDVSHWVSGLSGNASASSYEELDQSSEGWLAQCFNDASMNLNADDMQFSEAPDVQIDVTELFDIPPEYEANVVQQRVSRAPRNIIFKGRKSFIRTPTKLATSVAYPFAFIKPSGTHGDVTLKEINQRIRTPPPSKSKQNNEDPSAAYPTSAFSGKPVVGKTKIHTEGGKGSITIMRTKG